MLCWGKARVYAGSINTFLLNDDPGILKCENVTTGEDQGLSTQPIVLSRIALLLIHTYFIAC